MKQSVFDHITIGISDFDKSRKLYEQILYCLGYKVIFEREQLVGIGVDGSPSFWLSAEAPQHWGLHICFSAPSREAVDNFYTKALEFGAKDNGKPGLRDYAPNYYAAYVVDADGYRLEAVCHNDETAS